MAPLERLDIGPLGIHMAPLAPSNGALGHSYGTFSVFVWRLKRFHTVPKRIRMAPSYGA